MSKLAKLDKQVIDRKTTFRPIIDIKISDDGHQLELTIPEKDLTLVTQSKTLFNEKKEVFLVFTSKETIARPIFNVVIPNPTTPIDQRPFIPVPPPPPPTSVLAIISRATGRPLHYDIEREHITANVSLTEGEINANYHRINVSGTGQRESSTLTANMNNFRVRAHNNGDLLVRHVADDTDDTETPELISSFQREVIPGSVGLVRFFISLPNDARRYLTVKVDGTVGTTSQLTDRSDFTTIVE